MTAPTTPNPTRESAPSRLRLSTFNVAVDHEERHHIFNGVSGTLHSLDASQHDALTEWLDGEPLRAEHEQLYEQLIQSRVVVPHDVDERDLLRHRYHQSRSDKTHLGLTIISSMGCNFDCPYCFEHKRPALLNEDVATSIRNLIDARLRELETLFVTWYGGEPLLGADQLLELAHFMQDRCELAGVELQSSIVTNGWHLDAEMAQRLVDAGVPVAQVTIDGPPDVHNVRRPHLNGGETFERIIANVAEAADIMQIVIRVNADATNIDRVPELIERFDDAGLAGRVKIYLGKIDPVAHNPLAPSASYDAPCHSLDEFSDARAAFDQLARSHGFEAGGLPAALANPCTAIRTNELIVGAKGELWKCIDNAGDDDEIVGTIFEVGAFNSRVKRWFDYDPFADDDCMNCVALPVCMGGCALFAMTPDLEDRRCSTFRDNHQQEIRDVIEQSSDRSEAVRRLAALGRVVTVSTPVTLERRS